MRTQTKCGLTAQCVVNLYGENIEFAAGERGGRVGLAKRSGHQAFKHAHATCIIFDEVDGEMGPEGSPTRFRCHMLDASGGGVEGDVSSRKRPMSRDSSVGGGASCMVRAPMGTGSDAVEGRRGSDDTRDDIGRGAGTTGFSSHSQLLLYPRGK